jgi:anti-sigma-K factor RskA
VRLRREVPHTLAGAYALDALTEPDRARFERHLIECDVCQQEASSLREAAGQLAAASAVTPPGRLRDQVLAVAALTRQQPPFTGDGLTGPAGLGAGRRGRGGVRLMAPRMAVAIAGGCMLVALVLGGLFLNTQHRLHQEQAHSGQIAAVLNAPDATMMSVRGSAGGTATVVMSHHDRALVLTTARLPVLPTGMRYQVWVMGRNRVRPAGMLPEPHQGMTAPVVVTGVAAGDRVGLSVEPASGSPRPTSAPVLMVDLPS